MEKDSGEMNNLAFNKNFEKELNKHWKLIIRWAKETSDTTFQDQNAK